MIPGLCAGPTRGKSDRSRRDTDIIQEYYVPVESFVPFMDAFRAILLAGEVNVLSSTVRYVTPNATPVLAYAPHRPVFAIIQMSNVALSAEGQAGAEAVTRRLVDAALEIVRPDLLSITHEVDPAVIDRLIAKGWPAFIWTIDEEPDLRAAFSRRPYGVISDQPLRARQVRGE